jgi:molecular chaperone GrpE
MTIEANKPEDNTEESDTPLTENAIPDNAMETAGTKIETELAETQKELLYLRAEFDNFRKRILKEQEQSVRFANEKIIREILLTADLLDRAIAHGKQTANKENPDADFMTLLSGVEMTQRELTQLLTRFGVEFIGAVGEKFDPNRHEAIAEEIAADNKIGTVLKVLQRGCLLHGRLLLPAKVVVSTASAKN